MLGMEGKSGSWRNTLKKKLRINNLCFRFFMSEFLATFVLMAFILGCIAQGTFGARYAGGYGGMLGGYMGGGFAVSMGMYVGGGVSGGHVNPAITLAAAIIGMVKWKHVPFYMLGQYLGSFAAAACIYGVYNDALNDFDGGNRSVTGPNATAGIFATYPKPYVSIGTAMGDAIFATALLVIGALSIIDPKNTKPDQGLVPLGVGLCVIGITCAFNLNIMTGINPARDLSPRIFTAIAGWGNQVFSIHEYKWFWIPVVGPHIGGIGGGLIYQLLVGWHYPTTDEEVSQKSQINKIVYIERSNGQETQK